jgi:hypothetical protein
MTILDTYFVCGAGATIEINKAEGNHIVPGERLVIDDSLIVRVNSVIHYDDFPRSTFLWLDGLNRKNKLDLTGLSIRKL